MIFWTVSLNAQQTTITGHIKLQSLFTSKTKQEYVSISFHSITVRIITRAPLIQSLGYILWTWKLSSLSFPVCKKPGLGDI